MVDERSYERGRDKLREVHGERALATVESLGDLGRLIVEMAYGNVYSRPGLTLRERQIASVAALVATGRSSHEGVPIEGALWSLGRAVEDWKAAVRLAAERNVVLQHPERGRQTAEDVAFTNAHDAHHHVWDIRRSTG